MFQAGDRVRWETTGDDGLPMVRYGFVGGFAGSHDAAVVMLDGDITGDTVIDLTQLAPVMITNVELRLHGADLLDDPTLRQGLVNLWSAEADQAGLEIVSLECLGTGVRDAGNGFALAELWAGSHQYVLRASIGPSPDTVSVRADLPRRWD
jgi:hypothetical protein